MTGICERCGETIRLNKRGSLFWVSASGSNCPDGGAHHPRVPTASEYLSALTSTDSGRNGAP
jgi:hypothetical protein